MNETKTSCAPADNRNLTSDGMNWSKCEAYVRKLQARIVKAQKEGLSLIHILQASSISSKLLPEARGVSEASSSGSSSPYPSSSGGMLV